MSSPDVLNRTMSVVQRMLDLIHTDDLCSLLLLLFVLFFVGGKMVAGFPRLQSWGMRLAALGFVGYGVYALIRFSPTEAREFFSLSVRGLFASALALTLSWIVLPAGVFLYHHTLGALLRLSRRWASDWKVRHQAYVEKCRREWERWQAAQEYERRAPERERAQREYEERQRAEAEARKRRQDARARCEFQYDLHALELKDRFPRSRFDEFAAKYLGDSHPPEEVERRAEQLLGLIRQHLEKVEPPPKFQNLADLAAWFEQQKQQIDAVADDKLKRTLLVKLKDRYTELSSKMLEDMQP